MHPGQGKQSEIVSAAKHGVLMALAIACLVLPPGGLVRVQTTALLPKPAPMLQQIRAHPPATEAQFGTLVPTTDAKKIADWVASSADNHGAPFVVLDKRGARVYVFDAAAKLLGSSLVLLGSAIGDDSAPNIGNRRLSEIRSDERTTAAGRFISEPGHDETGDQVVWVDYDTALAMHRVKIVDPKEHRFERIATDSVLDKRISNGCINVPIPFFDTVIQPVLGHSRAVVYILPEIKPLDAVFPAASELASR